MITEPTDEEILRLIQHATDESTRATLLVLYQINKNLIHNTSVTVRIAKQQEDHEEMFKAHRKDFSNHVIDEAALFNKGIGAWRALSITSLVVMSVMGYLLSEHSSDAKLVNASNAMQDIEIKRIGTELRFVLERMQAK